MLTELQTKKLTRYFQVYDIDDNGRIGPLDFERVVENVRMLHGLAESSPGHRALRDGYFRRWEALRASADANDDGGVDLSEWLKYWAAVLRSEDRYQTEAVAVATRLLELFDTDEDGVLEVDEFCDFYSIFGQSMDLARQIFAELDVNDDGVISRDELLEMVHQFYRSDDPTAPGNRLYGPYED
jgi:juvenile hormone diol kinase